MRFRPAVVGLLLSACLATPILGQGDHPNRAAGISAQTLYSSSGTDDINLFNGNLHYRIPIGEPVAVGPLLSIAPAVVYNSQAEKVWRVCKENEEHPTGDRAIGPGWRLHFGRLVPVETRIPRGSTDCWQPSTPEAPLVDDAVYGKGSTGWAYEDPEGGIHEFYDRLVESSCNISDPTCEQTHPPKCFDPTEHGTGHCFAYTHDGSFLRLDPIDPEHGGHPTVYFPDGTFRVLGFRGGRYPILGTSLPTDLDYAETVPAYHTTLAGDLFGNQYSVQYYGDGTPGSLAHPLLTHSVPENQWDAIPYRAFPSSAASPYTPLHSSVVFQVDVTTVFHQPDWHYPNVWAPKITQVVAPTAASDGAGGWRSGAWVFGRSDSIAFTSLELPTMTGQESVNYVFSYGSGALIGVRLPTLGSVEYTYGDITLWTRQPSHYVLPDGASGGFQKDFVRGVTSRQTRRDIRTSIAGVLEPEVSTTVYSRSYVVEDACSESALQNCRLRVDVWAPRVYANEPYKVTRTVFHESDQRRNTALYGRPISTSDYFVTASTPDRAAIDSASSFRVTAFRYDFDGPRDPLNPAVSIGAGFQHKTREIERTTTWGDHALTESRSNWDGFGHWGTTVQQENDGVDLVELKRTQQTHLNRVSDTATAARWILDPVTSRTVSRPFVSGLDPTQANLSTTETFTYDTSGFLLSRRVESKDTFPAYADNRVRTETFTRGTASSAPCLYGGASRLECGNRGFPTKLVESLTGSLNGTAVNSSYTRYLYYQYGVLSAARDSGTTFYSVDRDIAPTGKVVGERPSAGRTSLTDANPALTTTSEYDLLGRVTRVVPPQGEAPTEVTYASRHVTRTQRDGSSILSQNRVFFDDLGRPIVELRRMPAGAFSYRVSTIDSAGRSVGATEWSAVACSATDLCPGLDRLQASISTVTHVSTPPGTVSGGFDALGRPAWTRRADGSTQSNTYLGWWERSTSRTVNTGASAIPSVYVYQMDALGQLTSVVEPEARSATGALMNPAETTAYRYDHMGRLIRSVKSGSNSNGVSPVSQDRTSVFDDFGWLTKKVDPESRSDTTAHDARGNVTRVWDGDITLAHTYDAAGRLRTSKYEMDIANPILDLYYDAVPGSAGYSGNMGRSNGRLVYAIRNDHTRTSHLSPSSPNVPVDFGWMSTMDLFHYTGLGGRLGFRQMQTFLIDGSPAVPPNAVSSSSDTKKRSLADSIREYFTGSGRSLDKAERSLSKVLPADPEKDGRAAPTGSPQVPSGWLRWGYSYDNGGRVSKVTYPRRDEGYPTEAVYSYDAGLPASVSVTFRNPFSYGAVGSATANLAYNPSGSVASTTVLSGGSTGVFRLETPDEASGVPRPTAWTLTRTSSQLPVENRPLVYDASGNVAQVGGATYLYDTRGRLIRDSLPLRSYNPVNRLYDGFGNLTSVTNENALSVNRANNQIVGPGTMRWSSSGQLLYDGPRQLQRDYYPDGLLMTEYQHTGANMVLTSGISGWLYDASGERAMSFWGTEGDGNLQLYLHTPRDESGRVLTEYRAEPSPPCVPDAPCTRYDRYQKDYVWVGKSALLTWTRGTGSRFSALNHLGSPEYVFDESGNQVGRVKLDSFGQDLGTTAGVDRHRFTGHERDHVTNLDGPSLPLADHMHARTYVPMLGRFTRPDPANSFSLFNPQSFNRYTYALNSPLRFVDPDGRTIEVSDRAARAFLVSTLTRPSGRAAIEAIANDPNFHARFRTGLITPLGLTERADRTGSKVKVVFGLATPTGAVKDGKFVATGADVKLDGERIRKYHADPTGVNTTAHELYHTLDVREGKVGDELKKGDLPANETGPAAQAGTATQLEDPTLTPEQAERLLDELLDTPKGHGGK